MRVEDAIHVRGAVKVHVDADELECSFGKRLPYPTCIGLVYEHGKIDVWTPAAYTPRGYRKAALRALEEVRDNIKKKREEISREKGGSKI